MTPERLKELRTDDDRHARDDDDTLILRVGLYRDLLTTAERYLWLRRNPSVVFASVSGPFGPTLNSGDRLDAAIDAAMKGGD